MKEQKKDWSHLIIMLAGWLLGLLGLAVVACEVYNFGWGVLL